jgi:hypothetical protein
MVAKRPVKRLRFSRGNAKLDDAIYIFSLPAGQCCPGALFCKSKSDRKTGKITDGKKTVFRCYAATMEARWGSIRKNRWHNLELVKGLSSAQVCELILESLSPYAGYCRVHDSGDFFSPEYFDGWMLAAAERPRTTFYAYTKSLNYWVASLEGIPENFVLTASKGGRFDNLIYKHHLRYAQVVYSFEEAAALGLEVDDDDSHAMVAGPSFALLIHGTQPPGSEAGKALYRLRAEGHYGYGSKKLSLPVL